MSFKINKPFKVFSGVFKVFIIAVLIVMFSGAGLLAGAMFGFIKTAQPIKEDDLEIKIQTTFIYDEAGNKIAELTGFDNKNRELVKYKDIPEFLKQAFVAVEDERFFEHRGVDIKRTLSAAISFITTGGNASHGGSTITQQVVKNITGNTTVSLQRKIQEQWNAIQLERKLNKWQILELYMNIIYMGNSYYGVQSASKAYFGKPVKDLSLAECALLAGITNSPAKYNLFTEKGRKNAKERQEIILALMLKQGKISKEQYEQALKEKLYFMDKPETEKGIKIHSYFVDQVINDVIKDLMSEKNISREEAIRRVYNNGLRIYTTQNPEIQSAVDEVFTNPEFQNTTSRDAVKLGEKPQASIVIIDPYTGQVKAMYGGLGEKNANQTLNRATQAKRQPGSSIKPLSVYAPGIDTGSVTPGTIIDDVPVYMDTTGKNKDRPYPKNYDLRYAGLTSIRNAIKNSVNVVAATVLRDYTRPDISIQYLSKVGIDRQKERNIAALALGAFYEGINTYQLAAAYQPFVNKGLFYEPATYTKVTDSSGKLVMEKKQNTIPVYKEATAFIMTELMKEVVKPRNSTYPFAGTAARYGTIKNAKGQIIPSAGKTGTTSDNIDKWFVGYTPYYVSAVWYGYDNKIKPITIPSAERSQALKIWQDVMLKVHKNLEPKDFNPEPSDVVKKSICIYSGKIATDLCSRDPRGNAAIEEYFIKGTEPKDDDLCDVHVEATVCKYCTDVWGRNLLAGIYCPPESRIIKVFIQRKVPYIPVDPHDPSLKSWIPSDFIYELPAGEYCTKHTSYSSNSYNSSNNNTPQNNNLPSPNVYEFDDLENEGN